MEVGQKVYWHDPDGGKCSGEYKVINADHPEIIFLVNKEGSELEASISELEDIED